MLQSALVCLVIALFGAMLGYAVIAEPLPTMGLIVFYAFLGLAAVLFVGSVIPRHRLH